MKKRLSVIKNLVLPTLVLGALTGVATSAVVNFYKYLAKHIIHFAESIYSQLADNPLWIVGALAAALISSFLLSLIYKRYPALKGGGIPISIAALRAITKLKWFVNVVGVFVLSLVSFLFGVPLGNEGPSVQMGCAIGAGMAKIGSRNHRAWERYSMTGGACAGFSVATGAPVSGVVFAIEEAHRRISPMILASAASAVFFASITTEILAPVLGVSRSLIPGLTLPTLTVSELWIVLITAVVLGLFAVVFLKAYGALNIFYNKTLGKLPHMVKIFLVMAVTVAFGAFSVDFISTGHELAVHLLAENASLVALLAILGVRCLLTLSANSNGITGGTFLPMLAIGAVAAGLAARLMTECFGMAERYYTVVIVMGLVGCIAAMMKMPLTAVVFAAEALGCINNMAYVILVALISYMITEICGVNSINDAVVEAREEELSERSDTLAEITMTVRARAFAQGRPVSDILWPYGLVILSVQHEAAHGGSLLSEGDMLTMRCMTADKAALVAELEDILGKQ